MYIPNFAHKVLVVCKITDFSAHSQKICAISYDISF